MKKIILILLLLLNIISCDSENNSETVQNDEDIIKEISIVLNFNRTGKLYTDPVEIEMELKENEVALTGVSPQISAEKGSLSEIKEKGNGIYSAILTPEKTGIYPVTVSYENKSVTRKILVVRELMEGVSQPILVPGMINSEGYEDGITITPDGNYLFIQYGPLYFSGIFLCSEICAEEGWSMYNLKSCEEKDDSKWVFDTIGPYSAPLRPDFPTGAIENGKLTHIDITIDGVANKIALFPTVFYGFKRDENGEFTNPFKVSFNDARGTNGPFGLSFRTREDGITDFTVAWNNYFEDLGDDKPDIYSGTMKLGENTNLGDVAYNGDMFASIKPNVKPVNFPSHDGVQGNPSLYNNENGKITSIWTDDEQVTHDISVYILKSGSYPDGEWEKLVLPSKINTEASESQPYFTGKRLYLNRDTHISYHEYLGISPEDYDKDSSWGDEVTVIKGGDFEVGTIYGMGEPTIANYNGKTYLYFAYVEIRSPGETAGRYDLDLGAAFLEIKE